jgi:hypothetical protein
MSQAEHFEVCCSWRTTVQTEMVIARPAGHPTILVPGFAEKLTPI